MENNNKLLPNAIDLEKSILGAILIDNTSLLMIANFIKPEHFYLEKHSIIYNTILSLYKKNLPYETIEVVQLLRDNNKIDEIGGAAYIIELTKNILSSSHIMYHSMVVMEKYMLRSIINVSNDATNKAFNNESPFEISGETSSKLVKLIDDCKTIEKKELSIKIGNSIDSIINIHTNQELYDKAWYKFGIKEIDEFALVSPNQTLLIGGKSGSAKTRFVIYLMRSLLRLYGNNIAIKWYSMEDDMQKIIRCMISPMVSLTDEQLEGKNYKLNEEDIHALLSQKMIFQNYDVEIIEDSRFISEIAMETKAFVSKRQDKMNILIIDNLMLLNDHKSNMQQLKIDDRIALEIKDIRTTCHNNGYKLYIIVLHHFTDEQLDKNNIRTAYRPTEKNFKGSTRIRDAATQIMLLNRISNYPDLIEQFPNMEHILNKLLIIEITKNRNGSTGITRWFTNMPFSKFKIINSKINK